MVEQPSDSARRLAALDALQKAEGKPVRGAPSSLRLHIRDNLASLVAARGRGVSWQQITDVMTAAGVRAPGGGRLTWRKVAVLFHAEQREKDPKRKRRALAAKREKRAKAPPVSMPALPQPAVAVAPPAPPSPQPEQPQAAGAPFATGDPALDRALNIPRGLTPLPPRDLEAGWRGVTKPTERKADDENG